MRTLLRTVITGAALAAACSAWAADADPGLGTWKLNAEKSKFSGPPPKSLTTTFEADGTDAVKWKSERITPDSKSLTATYTGRYDGKDYPLAGSPNADTVSLRRIDALTTERTNKKAGKVVNVETRRVSADGKSYTTIVKGINDKGEPVETVMVFDKQ